MTRYSHYKPTAYVQKYYDFRDAITKQFKVVLPPDIIHLTMVFFFPMPKSWSAKKKTARALQPHRAHPDCDNVIKAFIDAACGSRSVSGLDDKRIPAMTGYKIWLPPSFTEGEIYYSYKE